VRRGILKKYLSKVRKDRFGFGKGRELEERRVRLRRLYVF